MKTLLISSLFVFTTFTTHAFAFDAFHDDEYQRDVIALDRHGQPFSANLDLETNAADYWEWPTWLSNAWSWASSGGEKVLSFVADTKKYAVNLSDAAYNSVQTLSKYVDQKSIMTVIKWVVDNVGYVAAGLAVSYLLKEIISSYLGLPAGGISAKLIDGLAIKVARNFTNKYGTKMVTEAATKSLENVLNSLFSNSTIPAS